MGEPQESDIVAQIRGCRICAPAFAATASAHAPRPVAWFRPSARILIAGQAPGMRVHTSGRPFTDPSGDRLREWLGLSEPQFYDPQSIAIVPMAFCFPGYDAKGADLPPPAICAKTWRTRAMAGLPALRLTLLVGAHAMRWHLARPALEGGVSATVARWRSHAPAVFPLPHPSWRNTGWLKRNPWFGEELLPVLRARVQEVLHD